MKKKKEYFKVGDYVYFNHMDKYCVGRIHKIIDNQLWCNWSAGYYKNLPKSIKEFNAIEKEITERWMPNNKSDDCSVVFKLNFKPQFSEAKIIKHIIVGNKTIVIVPKEDGTYSKGISRCLPEDEFDGYIGFCIAYGRALTGMADLTFNVGLSDYSDEKLIEELGKRLNMKEGK